MAFKDGGNACGVWLWLNSIREGNLGIDWKERKDIWECLFQGERERGGVWPREPPLGLAVVSSDHDWGEIKGGENRETERERECVCFVFLYLVNKKKN